MSETDELKKVIEGMGYSWRVGRSSRSCLYYGYIDTESPDYVVGYGMAEDSELKALTAALEEVKRIIADG